MRKTNSFDSRFRYDKLLIITSKIYLQIISNLMLKIYHSIGRASDVDYSTSEEGRFGRRIFVIRRRVLWMSTIRHSTGGWSNVKYSTFDGGQYRIENCCTPLLLTSIHAVTLPDKNLLTSIRANTLF